jgi:hypothetical protein
MSKITLKIYDEQEDALSQLVLALEKSLGCKVAFVQCSIYEVESEDPRAIAILQSVFGEEEQPPADKQAGQKMGKAAKKEKNGIHRAYHTRKDERYQVLNSPAADLVGQEFISGVLAMKLKAGKIPEGTTLRHPSKGIFSMDLVAGKLQLVKTVEVTDMQP